MDNVKDLIPHRDPFLFVDEIIELDDEHIEAVVTIDPESDFFKGHYPGFPIMPGVLVCECVVQAGALFLSKLLGGVDDRAPVLTRLGKAKFRRMVLPGDRVTLTAKLDQRFEDVFYMKGRATVDCETAVTLEYTCALVDKAALLANAGK